jgi:hypothetical protein
VEPAARRSPSSAGPWTSCRRKSLSAAELGRDIADSGPTFGAGAAQPILSAYLVADLGEPRRPPGASTIEHRIEGAAHAGRPTVQYVGVDLGRRDVAVPEQLLNGPDIAAVLEQMGGEGMA